MAVEAVGRGVQLAAGEPLRERRVRPVEDRRPRARSTRASRPTTPTRSRGRRRRARRSRGRRRSPAPRTPAAAGRSARSSAGRRAPGSSAIAPEPTRLRWRVRDSFRAQGWDWPGPRHSDSVRSILEYNQERTDDEQQDCFGSGGCCGARNAGGPRSGSAASERTGASHKIVGGSVTTSAARPFQVAISTTSHRRPVLRRLPDQAADRAHSRALPVPCPPVLSASGPYDHVRRRRDRLERPSQGVESEIIAATPHPSYNPAIGSTGGFDVATPPASRTRSRPASARRSCSPAPTRAASGGRATKRPFPAGADVAEGGPGSSTLKRGSVPIISDNRVRLRLRPGLHPRADGLRRLPQPAASTPARATPAAR